MKNKEYSPYFVDKAGHNDIEITAKDYYRQIYQFIQYLSKMEKPVDAMNKEYYEPPVIKFNFDLMTNQ